MEFLAGFLRETLNVFYQFVGNYGLAIIMLTILVKLLLLPLTISQMRATKKMTELAPLMKELQEKYKNDPQRMQKETLELYKKHGANPVAGCLPMLLQFPIFIALYQALVQPHWLATPMFLGFDLAVNVTQGAAHSVWYYAFPLLAAGTTYWQMAISTPPSAAGMESTQRMMFYMMPLLFGWVTLQTPAGLSLYWIVSNLFGIVQAYLMPGYRPSVPAGKEAAR